MITRKFLRNEGGYSLVEVIVSILILTVAIIPMVGMFDAGLNAAVKSGEYDKARALANRQLETVKALSYDDARDKYPDGTGSSAPQLCPASCGGVTGLNSYKVSKQFIEPSSLGSSATDKGIMKVTVTVAWKGTKTYETSGVVSR